MRELVGNCIACRKEIYCLDGFFNGVHSDEGKMYCFECYKDSTHEENPQD
jgi:hypothetical protein